jgi:hypothetical protein
VFVFGQKIKREEKENAHAMMLSKRTKLMSNKKNVVEQILFKYFI